MRVGGAGCVSRPDPLALVDHVIGHSLLEPFECDFLLGDPDDLPPHTADLAAVKGVELDTKS